MDLIYLLYFLVVTPVFNPPEDWDAHINENWGSTYNPFIHVDIGYGFPGQESFASTFSSVGTAGLKWDIQRMINLKALFTNLMKNIFLQSTLLRIWVKF